MLQINKRDKAMFSKAAERAETLSKSGKMYRFCYMYYIKVGERKSVIIEAPDMDKAARSFNDKFPTATIIHSAMLDS